MPRLNYVKAAAKDHPDYGIKKGEFYYWWKFRRGGKHVSKTQPPRSALIASPFLSAVAVIEERIEKMKPENIEDFQSERDEIAEEIRNLGEEQQEKLDNMPDSLQQGPTGELLQGRVDSCEEWASEVEGVEVDEEEELSEAIDAAVSEIAATSYNGE